MYVGLISVLCCFVWVSITKVPWGGWLKQKKLFFFPGLWRLDPCAGMWSVHVVERAFGLAWGSLPSVWLYTFSYVCRWMEGGSEWRSFPVSLKKNNPTEWLFRYYDLKLPSPTLPPASTCDHFKYDYAVRTSKKWEFERSTTQLINTMVAFLNIRVP